MVNAIDVLIADHRMIRKILGNFHRTQPRLNLISKSLVRAVKSHAWFEDQVFIPAFENERLLEKKFVQEIVDEHKDIEVLMASFLGTRSEDKDLWEAKAIQFKALMESHFLKEEDGLFPICSRTATPQKLTILVEEMRRRQPEVLKIL